MNRCMWGNKNELLKRYHDLEWGVPILDTQSLFECFALEIFQAGLNWVTVLKRREAFRNVFAQFDPQILSLFTDYDISQILTDATIIRNERKIKAVVQNAQVVANLPMNFSDYIWQFVDFEPIRNPQVVLDDSQSRICLTNRIASQMKVDGFIFVGPKMINAFLQAAGLINDHEVSCFRYHNLAVQ